MKIGSKVNTFYCMNTNLGFGCDLAIIYPYAGSDFPTEEELAVMVCPKCGWKGFSETPTDRQRRNLLDD